MTQHSCDVAIIGAGTAGLVAERLARAAGAKTLLIDEKFAGTVCANVGCMPSKLLLAAASAAHSARRALLFGVTAEEVIRHQIQRALGRGANCLHRARTTLHIR